MDMLGLYEVGVHGWMSLPHLFALTKSSSAFLHLGMLPSFQKSRRTGSSLSIVKIKILHIGDIASKEFSSCIFNLLEIIPLTFRA